MKQLLRRAPIALCIVTLLLAAIGTWLFAAGDKNLKEVNVDTPNGFTTKKDPKTGLWITVYKDVTMTQDDAVFTAGTVEQETQNKTHKFTCTDHPVYNAPENKITSEKAVFFTTPRHADFTNNVKATHISKKQDSNGKLLGDSTTVITSEHLSYDYGKKWAEFTGGEVKMVNTPVRTGKGGDDVKDEISKDPSTLICDKITYDYANKRALATCNPGKQVYIIQKEREIWADQATFDEATNLAVLKGNVKMKNAGDEELKLVENADTVTTSLDDNWMDLQPLPGKKIHFRFEVQDDSADNSTPAKKK